MTDYASRVQAYYETYLPSRVAALPNPSAFYRKQGKEIARQVRDLETAFAGTDSPDEDYLAKVGRLTTARKQAEEKVLGEVLFSLTPEPGTEDKEPPLPQIPGVSRVE